MSNSQDWSQLQEWVYVVDDEADYLEVVLETLQMHGFKAKGFPKAEDFPLNLDPSERPFLVISDFRMPGMNGLNFATVFKEKNPQIPFVLLTGYADKSVAIEGLSARIDTILEKPLQNQKLIEVVSGFAKKRLAYLEAERVELDEIRVLFVEESRELLSDADQLIMRLEQSPGDMVVVDLLFRKVHSVKGGASALPGGKDLSVLAHHFESVLSDLRKPDFTVDRTGFDVMLRAADLCRTHLDLINSNSPVPPELAAESQEIIQFLDGLLSGEKVAATVAPKIAPRANSSSNADTGPTDEGVMVTSEKLDSFMKLSGELVVLKNNFQLIVRDADLRTNPVKFEKKLGDLFYSMNKITDDLQDQIMSVRKVTLDRALGKLPRVVRQLSQSLGKDVRLEQNGWDLGVDKAIAKSLSSVLTHMVRNSLDHGIETPDVRVERGKPGQGTLEITCREVQGNIQIVVRDDGGGIDPKKLIKKSIEKNLITEAMAETMSDGAALELIFMPGFSTAEAVSDVSGRGVGMDVVRSAITSLNGRVSIDSEIGKGTMFTLDIPVPKTVMVEQTVIAESHGTLVAIPLQSISRILTAAELVTNYVDHKWTFQHDNRTLRLVDYRNLEHPQNRESHVRPDGSVIVIRNKTHQVGLLVDIVHDQLEAVVRPFNSVIREVPGFRGTTVLGDDQVAYVVSPNELITLTLDLDQEQAA